MKPRMFIGSSVEGKEIAEYLQLGLDHDVETTIWHQGIFGLSEGSLASLVRAAKDFDFAALVLTPDDLVTKRGTEKGSPRDNVVFELGLFMGALGRERTFIVYDRDKKPDLPSDLAGVTAATFGKRSDDNLRAAVGLVCTQIKDAIKACGVKASHAAEAEVPAPAAKTEPPVLIVDQNGRGDYETITAALKAAKPSTRILVRPGWYNEDIVINKPVEIVGDGEKDKIVIENSGNETILFQTGTGRVANLTLRQKSSSSSCCVNITKGWLVLEDCDISSQNLGCVAIRSGANPTLCRNRIYDGMLCGVLVKETGQGTLEDNEIFANTWAGVDITGGNPILRRNRITQNGGMGIFVRNGGGGTFEDNDLQGNAAGAWDIAPDCEANVQRRGNKE